MDNLLEKAKQNGLIDVIKDWMKNERYISISSIQRNFSVGFNTACAIFDYLIEEGLVEKEPTYNKGHRVIFSQNNIPVTIYLLDINNSIINEFEKAFNGYPEVVVIQDDFAHFMKTHDDVECIVSPANSFGEMSGGYDKAIRDYFGLEVEKKVKRYINDILFGEQIVGSAFTIDIPHTNKKLIHTPTMRLPSPILDPKVIYYCMRATMMEVFKNNIHSVVIPAFGGATGRVKPEIIAKYMRAAYDQILEHIKEKGVLRVYR